MLKANSGTKLAPQLRERLLVDKILIRELSEFKGLGENFFRVAIKKREDNVFLVERLKEVLGELQLT